MELSESLKIINKLELLFPSFKPDVEAKNLWTEELRDIFKGYTCDELWPTIRTVLREECCKFAPTPYELAGKVRYKLYNAGRDQRREDQKLLGHTEEPGASLEDIADNVRRVADMVAAATPGKEEVPDLLKRARAKSCDDLEEASLKTDSQTLEG